MQQDRHIVEQLLTLVQAFDEAYSAKKTEYKKLDYNDLEKYAFPYYKRLITLFQYPNVCLMVEWLSCDTRKEKCVQLIEELIKAA